MYKFIATAIFLFVSINSTLAQQPDDINGIWINENGDVKIEVYKSGGKYFGKITWIKEMYEPDGKTLKKDTRNPDIKLQNRNLINLDILEGFTYDDGVWTGGGLYDPKTGKKYDSKLKIKSGKLEIRGYLGSPMFGKTSNWIRT